LLAIVTSEAHSPLSTRSRRKILSSAIAEPRLAFRSFGGDQKLHRRDFLLRMLRQMLCVITAHKTGVGLVAGLSGEHLDVEGVGLDLVEGVLSIAYGA